MRCRKGRLIFWGGGLEGRGGTNGIKKVVLGNGKIAPKESLRNLS